MSVQKKDKSAALRKCLAVLSPEHREVIDLVYYHEKSVEEVAEIVGIPEPTVKTRMFYARKRLSELLKAAGITATGITSERTTTMLITIMKLAFVSPVHALQAACAAVWRWQRQRKAAADLHAMSDYSLRDIGIPRSQIDERVRLAAKRYVRPHKSTGLI